ncbi:MAG: glucans biosynthesis glucosyltransferase MdoH [Sandaracinaceae bacterium]
MAAIPELSEPSTPSSPSSRVRRRAPRSAREAAQLRVREYFLSVGLRDPEALDRHTASVMDASESPEAATGVAIERVERWLGELEPAPGLLRAVLASDPALFLDEARADELAVELERHRRALGRRGLAPQRLRSDAPRWLLGLVPALAVAVGTSAWLARALASDGLGALEVGWVVLFGALGFLNALSATIATIGFLRRLTLRTRETEASGALPRTAMVVPIYHEDAERVLASVAAMREALEHTAGGDAFDIFVLSDSRDPEKAADEERAWRRVAAMTSNVPVYYRRRADNARQKSGNLEDFLQRWGERYEYMVVLDADSLVAGSTLVELVRRMEVAPRLGLLQLPIEPVEAQTAFARQLQFTSAVYGPVFGSGLGAWAGRDGTYYGHNAIVRVRAFMECCALPALEGAPPLGGHILSHDFVEAALLRRGGWEVRFADDLTGSYEELPPTLADYATRDRRWCQGNLQHLRLIGADGFTPMSRLHLLLGAAGYLASPLWLLFVAVGVAQLALAPSSLDGVGPPLLGLAAFLLLWPRALGVLDTLLHRRRRFGIVRLLVGVLADLALGAIVAPRLMLYHTRFVLEIVLGRAVGWSAQRRSVGRSASREALIAHGPVSLLGVALGALVVAVRPELVPWTAPFFGALALAAPLAAWSASPTIGAWLRRLGIFVVPTEEDAPSVLARARHLRGLTRADIASRFRDLVLDPVLNAAHVARLEERATPAPASLIERALARGPAGLTEDERRVLREDKDAMRRLHREAWRRWPVELWDLGRDIPSEPAA